MQENINSNWNKLTNLQPVIISRYLAEEDERVGS